MPISIFRTSSTSYLKNRFSGEQLRSLMGKVAGNRGLCAEMGKAGKNRIRKELSAGAVGKIIRARLREIHQELGMEGKEP